MENSSLVGRTNRLRTVTSFRIRIVDASGSLRDFLTVPWMNSRVSRDSGSPSDDLSHNPLQDSAAKLAESISVVPDPRRLSRI